MDTSKIVEAHPIGTCLDTLHRSLCSLEQEHGNLDSVNTSGIVKSLVDLPYRAFLTTPPDLQAATIQLASLLLAHQASSVLPSVSGTTNLRADILRFNIAISTDFDFGRVKPLLATVLERKSDQELWDQVYKVVTESPPTSQLTPQPTPRPSSPLARQTPRTRTTGYIHNSSQNRASTDRLLKEELDVLYVDVPDFHKAFLSHIPGLEAATDAIFKNCQQRESPQYRDGNWVGWPEDANQYKVLEWLATFCGTLANMAKDHGFTTTRQLVSFADDYLESSTPARRKLDVGFVDNLQVQAKPKPSFSEIQVLGELKCNPKADTAAKAWFDNARYVREVFASQDNRRFVFSFTLCGSHMRVWKFDRIGGISSDLFDIHEDGPRLVSTLLGFLTIDQADLGYDPTIKIADDGERFIEINRNGKQERLFLLHPPILRAPCIVGRATTCWKAYNKDHPKEALVIKDSWQHPERDEEGDLLRMAFKEGVTNVAKYYHHETVQVGGRDDDILHNPEQCYATEKAFILGRDNLRQQYWEPDTQPESFLSATGYAFGLLAGGY
ncbi:hypothetical protein SLS53_005054 [Cytospora paraplurivora]|uniref:Fungal-type protein kinase domain-containing protein n=1 Tax=Cytospora paraplurivora TaxID=2898453 RepID=A0AAN9U8K7_9PEZI